jgi:hypothetical protein
MILTGYFQAGVNEVLGAQYRGKTLGDDGKRKIEPALINCRNDNFFKAQQYGRWIILNRQNPTEMLGEQVAHFPSVIGSFRNNCSIRCYITIRSCLNRSGASWPHRHPTMRSWRNTTLLRMLRK